jgi:hypothetical protein
VEKGVNEALEDLGCIGRTKMHEEEFENTERGDNNCLRNVSFFHGNLIISFCQINFGENFCIVTLQGAVAEV